MRRWQKSPVTGESTKETVKTIACGNAGLFRCTRCYSCAFYYYKCTRGRGCIGHPAFPTPSLGERFINASGAWRGEVVKLCLESRCRHSSCPGLTHRWPARFVLEGVHGIDSIRFQLVTNHLDSKGDQSRAASEYRLS